MSMSETLMLDVVDRLQTAAVIADVGNIRRDHRTILTRDRAPAVHVIDGDETPLPSNTCFCEVEFEFAVSIFVRADAGYSAADPIAVAIMAALDPAVSYGVNIDLLRGRIVREQEIADTDALRVDMEFKFRYQAPEWEI
jgi:hypothetical protein